MMRVFIQCLFLVCLCVLTVFPVNAQSRTSSCPVSAMLRNAAHSGWDSKTCVLEATAYIKNMGADAYGFCQVHANANLLREVGDRFRAKMEKLRNAGDPKYKDWAVLYHELLSPCQSWDDYV